MSCQQRRLSYFSGSLTSRIWRQKTSSQRHHVPQDYHTPMARRLLSPSGTRLPVKETALPRRTHPQDQHHLHDANHRTNHPPIPRIRLRAQLEEQPQVPSHARPPPQLARLAPLLRQRRIHPIRATHPRPNRCRPPHALERNLHAQPLHRLGHAGPLGHFKQTHILRARVGAAQSDLVLRGPRLRLCGRGRWWSAVGSGFESCSRCWAVGPVYLGGEE